MKPITLITIITLSLALVAIVVLVTREALQGPTFRAADHATLQECMRNIPAEWRLGSLERTRAEAACHHELEQRSRRQQ
jgi:hypothetical protein